MLSQHEQDEVEKLLEVFSLRKAELSDKDFVFVTSIKEQFAFEGSWMHLTPKQWYRLRALGKRFNEPHNGNSYGGPQAGGENDW